MNEPLFSIISLSSESSELPEMDPWQQGKAGDSDNFQKVVVMLQKTEFFPALKIAIFCCWKNASRVLVFVTLSFV